MKGVELAVRSNISHMRKSRISSLVGALCFLSSSDVGFQFTTPAKSCDQLHTFLFAHDCGTDCVIKLRKREANIPNQVHIGVHLFSGLVLNGNRYSGKTISL